MEGSLSGFSAQQAKEFHSAFMTGFIGFTIIAIIAHILVWMWRPWFPPVGGYTSMVETVQSMLPYLA
jgi:light-harvesting complex 1 beta chain